MNQIKDFRLKQLFLTTLFLLFCALCLGQAATSSTNFWEKVRYGGGIGLGFGNNSFNAAISPNAIYQANNQLAFGAGLSFNYSKFRDDKLLAYGASALTLFNPIREIQLSAEFEQLRINREFNTILGASFEDNYWYPALYMGIGYTTGNITVGLRYDVIYDGDRSLYADPWAPFFRVYF